MCSNMAAQAVQCLSEARQLMPCTSYTLMALQVVVGVLTKYVNLGKGWRHRLFVLRNGVLQYYKVTAAATI